MSFSTLPSRRWTMRGSDGYRTRDCMLLNSEKRRRPSVLRRPALAPPCRSPSTRITLSGSGPVWEHESRRMYSKRARKTLRPLLAELCLV
jgi:hypothetical protein